MAHGSIIRHADDYEDLEDWWENNDMVVLWIKLTFTPELSSSFWKHEITHALWTHIHKRFSVKNGQMVQRLKAELSNCH